LRSRAEGVPALIATNKKLVEQLRDKLIDHVRFVVWENATYPDADCGLTYATLKEAFEGDDFVSVRKGGCGDLFVGVPNS